MTNHEVCEIGSISEPSVMVMMIAVTTEPSLLVHFTVY